MITNTHIQLVNKQSCYSIGSLTTIKISVIKFKIKQYGEYLGT